MCWRSEWSGTARSTAASGTIRRGRGIAIGLKACVSPTTSVAIVHVYGDGSCALHCGTVDMGQASDTAMAQIAAEVLGIPTDIRPRRSSRHGCHAVRHGHARVAVDVPHGQRRAARRPRTCARSCCASPADALGADLDRARMRGRARSCRAAGARMTLREIMLARFAMQAGTIVGVGSYTPSYKKPDPETGQSPDITPFWMLGGAGAEIEVDMRDRPHRR